MDWGSALEPEPESEPEPEIISGSLPSPNEHPVTDRATAASTTLATFVPDDFSVLHEARLLDASGALAT
jgi:hypothetical protein